MRCLENIIQFDIMYKFKHSYIEYTLHRSRKGVRVRERLCSDRDEWVSFHAGSPAPRPTAPDDLLGYNVVTHDL